MGKPHYLKKLSVEVFWECVGSFLIAIGLYNFAIAAQLPLTGFSGISFLLNYLFGVPIGWTILVLNIPVALLCWRILGRDFFIRSIRCMIISSLMLDYLAPELPLYTGERLIAAAAAGVVAGLGYALIYTRNSSTGGLDFISMAIKVNRPHIPLGKITFGLDLLIISVSSLIFKDVDSLFYGLMVSFLLSIVVDKMIFGINAGKLALIVTEHGEMLCDVIEDTCHRGSTILYGAGGYQKTDKQVVLCVCGTKQMYELQKAIKRADPSSFVIILESNEVHGDGFQMVQFGDKVTGD